MRKISGALRQETIYILIPAIIFLIIGVYLLLNITVPFGYLILLPPVVIILGVIGLGVSFFVEKDARLRKESEEKFRNLIESVPVGIAVSTPEGEVLEANSALIKLFGYGSKEEFMGKPVQSLYHDPKDREQFVEIIEKEGVIRDFEVLLNRMDGAECWGSISSVKRKGPSGFRYFSVIQDITERKRAEDARRESEAKYRKVINTTSEGFWKFNNNAQLVEVNEAFLDMVEFELDEVRGKSVFDFIDDESYGIMKTEISMIPTSDHRKYEIILKKKTGRTVNVICNGTTIWDKEGNPMGAFAFITDISDQKEGDRAG